MGSHGVVQGSRLLPALARTRRRFPQLRPLGDMVRQTQPSTRAIRLCAGLMSLERILDLRGSVAQID
ncbi:hypothetical protein A6024_04700 [Rhodovulum sulfidophilum]|nr:hypothetical protein A6W98_04850 [Rhodovulum sulfidophilum DSM 1374]ANB37278.1 hypothetical protein A6024_04700 [Rhodovulum sulfidophilum]